jgi:DNA invertase Pin-like site-specific DNA recombinase
MKQKDYKFQNALAVPTSGRSPVYEKIKATMVKTIASGKRINYREIADECGAGYSTVKKHASAIKQELGQSA